MHGRSWEWSGFNSEIRGTTVGGFEGSIRGSPWVEWQRRPIKVRYDWQEAQGLSDDGIRADLMFALRFVVWAGMCQYRESSTAQRGL